MKFPKSFQVCESDAIELREVYDKEEIDEWLKKLKKLLTQDICEDTIYDVLDSSYKKDDPMGDWETGYDVGLSDLSEHILEEWLK